MRNLLFSVFAIGVAAVAAMTATTAMLNTPVRPSAAVIAENMQPESLQAEQPPAAPADDKPAASTPGAPPATSGGDTTAKPASGSATDGDTRTANGEEEVDKDPYEGVAPEELPPDLQYSADSSVSFPTNI